MSEIIPAILPKNTTDLIAGVSSLPLEIKIFHLDVLEEDVWEGIHRDFEVHLMVENPEVVADLWVERGAKRLIVHKLTPKILELRDRVELGLAVEMQVPLEEVFKQILEVDFVQIMSIRQIGEQGHLFEPEVFDRIREVRNKFPNIPISVDGGINVKNYQMLREMGVKRLVVGSGFKELWNYLTKE
ncbi:MAG: hypothetical protein ACYCY6_01465 [Minisyncoccota bacterium]